MFIFTILEIQTVSVHWQIIINPLAIFMKNDFQKMRTVALLCLCVSLFNRWCDGGWAAFSSLSGQSLSCRHTPRSLCPPPPVWLWEHASEARESSSIFVSLWKQFGAYRTSWNGLRLDPGVSGWYLGNCCFRGDLGIRNVKISYTFLH